jgi:NitT/TauT family transport system substrate-binding protein
VARHWRLAALLFALGVAGFAHQRQAHAADKVSVGVLGTVSDVGLFLAQENGYFNDNGVDATLETFDSAATMIAPLGAGQLDVGGGAGAVGLYNAIGRGIAIKIVADKGRNAPGYGYQQFLVRKDLVDSGKFKSFADLKGLKVAILGQGISDESVLNEAVKQGGLQFGDVQRVYLSLPQQLAAFKNGAIDAAISVEPQSSAIVDAGVADRFSTTAEISPNFQSGVLLYGGPFATQRADVAERFMRAYIRGVRFYVASLKGGKIAGPNADAVIATLIKYSRVKDPNILRTMTAVAIDPNGQVNVDTMRRDWEFFVAQGWTKGPVAIDSVVDMSFVRSAATALGPYKPAN